MPTQAAFLHINCELISAPSLMIHALFTSTVVKFMRMRKEIITFEGVVRWGARPVNKRHDVVDSSSLVHLLCAHDERWRRFNGWKLHFLLGIPDRGRKGGSG